MKTNGSRLLLELDAGAFLTSSYPKQLVKVRINKIPVAEITFTLDQPNDIRRLEIPAEAAEANPLRLLIDFWLENRISPKLPGLSGDSRELALALHTLRITDPGEP
jgi:hypothetical protein